MSSRVRKSELPAWADFGDWQPRPALVKALEQIQLVLGESCPNVRAGRTYISFDNIYGRTSVFAVPVDFMTPDGFHLLDRLVIRTVLPKEMDHWSESAMVVFNTFASAGALVIDPDTGERIMVSSVTFLEGDDDMLMAVYVRLVCWVAAFHVHCTVSPEDHGGWGLSRTDEPSFWTVDDFQPVADMLNQAGYYSNAGDTGLTSEFPWEDGAVSYMTDGVTSLMTFQTRMCHPHLGNGLFFKLELPDSYTADQLVDLVTRLNLQELTGADVPPFFGAWCCKDGSGRIAYVGFLPNMAYWPESVGQIASWLRMRAQIARAAIGNYLNAHEDAGVARLADRDEEAVSIPKARDIATGISRMSVEAASETVLSMKED